jgi:hypothetical protein
MTESGGRDDKGEIIYEMRETYAQAGFGAWKYATEGLPDGLWV